MLQNFLFVLSPTNFTTKSPLKKGEVSIVLLLWVRIKTNVSPFFFQRGGAMEALAWLVNEAGLGVLRSVSSLGVGVSPTHWFFFAFGKELFIYFIRGSSNRTMAD